jgi:hypothetical protein
MNMENEKVSAPVIPGNLAYCITRKPKVNQYTSIDTAFLDLQWLLRARSKDITRPNITGMLVESTKIIATDGHRLHIITNLYPSVPCGEYEVYGINQSKIILIAKTVDDKNKFPNWNRPVITMEGSTPEHEITVYHPAYFYTEILKHRPFEIRYLQDAISDEPMNVRIYGEKQPVIITTKTRTAIVIPLLDRKVS